MQKGTTYIIDNNPKSHELTSSTKVVYGNALQRIAGGQGMSPENFLRSGAEIYRNEVNALRASIGLEYSGVIDAVKQQKVLKDGLFAVSKLREATELRNFLERWMPKTKSVGDLEPVEVLLRNIVAPRLSYTSYARDGAGIDMPVFKYNNHLLKSVLQFGMEYGREFGSRDFVEKFIKEWEMVARGEHELPDMSFHERSVVSKYNWESLNGMVNPTKSLARNLGIFYASPDLMRLIDQVKVEGLPPVSTIEGISGDKLPVGVFKERSAMEIIGKIGC